MVSKIKFRVEVVGTKITKHHGNIHVETKIQVEGKSVVAFGSIIVAESNLDF